LVCWSPGLTTHSRRTASPPLNSSVEAVEKPFSDIQKSAALADFSFHRRERLDRRFVDH
jgi:hypothetical protein